MGDEREMEDIANERARQRVLGYGDDDDLPDGTGASLDRRLPLPSADAMKAWADTKSVTWADVLLEEVIEALEEDDPERLRRELIQVAAVAVRWSRRLRLREGKP